MTKNLVAVGPVSNGGSVMAKYVENGGNRMDAMALISQREHYNDQIATLSNEAGNEIAVEEYRKLLEMTNIQLDMDVKVGLINRMANGSIGINAILYPRIATSLANGELQSLPIFGGKVVDSNQLQLQFASADEAKKVEEIAIVAGSKVSVAVADDLLTRALLSIEKASKFEELIKALIEVTDPATSSPVSMSTLSTTLIPSILRAQTSGQIHENKGAGLLHGLIGMLVGPMTTNKNEAYPMAVHRTMAMFKSTLEEAKEMVIDFAMEFATRMAGDDFQDNLDKLLSAMVFDPQKAISESAALKGMIATTVGAGKLKSDDDFIKYMLDNLVGEVIKKELLNQKQIEAAAALRSVSFEEAREMFMLIPEEIREEAKKNPEIVKSEKDKVKPDNKRHKNK